MTLEEEVLAIINVELVKGVSLTNAGKLVDFYIEHDHLSIEEIDSIIRKRINESLLSTSQWIRTRAALANK